MAKRLKQTDPFAVAEAALRDRAIAYPAATEDFPWGERAIKVKGKVFIFLSRHTGNLHMTVKLPVSGPAALEMPFVEPTHYGMGKHGWVTAKFTEEDEVPVDLVFEWIDESYRAVAPKTILAKLEEDEVAKEPVKPAKKTKKKTK